MIRMRYSGVVIVLFCLILVSFGLMNKSSFTDIAKDEDFMDSLYVAEIMENFAVHECEHLLSELPNCQYILRVKAVSGVDYRYGVGRQKVEVLEVFEGKGIQTGAVIYITSPSWHLILYEEPKSVERGFVNVLNEDYEYLVFCSSLLDAASGNIPTYQLYSETYIAPVFCYADLNNVVVEPENLGTYVPYREVKDNEFFTCSQGALEVLLNLKNEMIARYSGS